MSSGYEHRRPERSRRHSNHRCPPPSAARSRPPGHTAGAGGVLDRPPARALRRLGLGIAVWARTATGYQSEEAKKRTKGYWKQNVSTFKDAPTPDMTFVDL